MDGLTVGVEEEYQLVDAHTGALTPGIQEVLPTATAVVGDQVEPELHQSQIEIGTAVCKTLDEVRDELTFLRVRVAAAAEAQGFRLVAAGTHPFGRVDEQRVTDKPAYRELAETYGHLAAEQLVFGCHVHVAVHDPELAIQVMNRMHGWLAPLLALSGSSPFWEGADTAYASYRSEVFARWPTAGPPSWFVDRADYDQMVDDLLTADAIDDPARLYLDVRPSARYPTLEVRIADVCTSVDDAVLVAGLVRGLVSTCADAALAGEPDAPHRAELLRVARWRAARHGLDGELIDLRSGRSVPAGDLLTALLEHVRPGLEQHGDLSTVTDLLEALRRRGTSAARQRRVLERDGDLAAVVHWLADETCARC